MTTIPSTLLNKQMSLISIDQFPQFVEEYPEMEQFYTFSGAERYDSDIKYAFGEDTIGDTCAN